MVAQVAALEPDTAAKIAQPTTFTCSSRPGNACIHGARPLNIDAGCALVDEGASAITTSYRFLVLFQRELQAALPVPVWTSGRVSDGRNSTV